MTSGENGTRFTFGPGFLLSEISALALRRIADFTGSRISGVEVAERLHRTIRTVIVDTEDGIGLEDYCGMSDFR